MGTLPAAIVLLVFGSFFGSTLGSCVTTPPVWECGVLYQPILTFEKTTVKECGFNATKNLFSKVKAVRYADANKNLTYRLIMVDPDAPGHDNGDAWLHWIQSGVQGADLLKGHFNGKEITSYNPPTPPKNSGVHRYFFFIYEETSQSASAVQAIAKRGRFNIQNYAANSSLCGPDASTMFTTKF
ncbi:unnamed protein product [Meganyctiphanes norvegica]|uniref:Phosphatidylethanolamine-binding protein n=1 Tax=Meganyctiphanes norvegica TaxID=48144 RepID=A0AAV2PX37_MEGNR